MWGRLLFVALVALIVYGVVWSLNQNNRDAPFSPSPTVPEPPTGANLQHKRQSARDNLHRTLRHHDLDPDAFHEGQQKLSPIASRIPTPRDCLGFVINKKSCCVPPDDGNTASGAAATIAGVAEI